MTRLLTILLLATIALSLYLYVSRTHVRDEVDAARDRVARVEAERAQLRSAVDEQNERLQDLHTQTEIMQARADSLQAVAARRAERARTRIARVPLPADTTCSAALQYARIYTDSLSTW